MPISKVDEVVDISEYDEASSIYLSEYPDFDYVQPSEDEFSEDIEWLKSSPDVADLFVADTVVEISAEKRRKYFEKKFNNLKKLTENLDFEDFCGNNGYCPDNFYIKQQLDERYDFYVNNHGYVDTFDSFVREYNNGLYKIVRAYDYHC